MRTLALGCITILLLNVPVTAIAQDTSYQYISSGGRDTTREAATRLRKIFRSDTSYCLLEYRLPGNLLELEGNYADSALKKKTGTWKLFSTAGIQTEQSRWINNERVEHWLWYDDGSKRMHAFLENDVPVAVTGWDESGNAIDNFIYEQPADFPGGVAAWSTYLSKRMNSNLPRAFLKGQIEGRVEVNFVINKEGQVADVTIHRSSGFEELDNHALNIIRETPRWNPAIQYNRRVIYHMRQPIIYRLQ